MPTSAKQQLNDIIRDIYNTTESLKQSRRLRDLADWTINTIVKRTRQGKGVRRPGANVSALKALKPSTVKKRKAVAALLHPLTSPGKSNLTYTGQMLDSMKLTFPGGRGLFQIAPYGGRTDIYGRPDKVTNEQVAEFVSAERPFNHLSRGEMTGLVRYYQRTYDRLLKMRGLT